uniref:Uncharacterized protein n=1 Tax=Tanacetum cinerariifolium TaxID=118510 RepID=A0A6L2LPW1_TANCI|nr:hypothetical protein [Tanacetum cinerariifolium]GEX11218.1 hypothetical protein [Tanacetum cinerariifolium]
MMSPGGSIVASLENINGFLDVNTPPDDLIRTYFDQEGVVPKVMLHIFKEFVLLLGRHPFYNEVPHMVVCKMGKPWCTLVTTKRYHVKCLKGSQLLFITDSDIKFLQEENPADQSWFGILLVEEDRTNGKITCVAHKLKGKVPIGGNKDWCFSQFLLECLKGFNTLFGEEEQSILFRNVEN